MEAHGDMDFGAYRLMRYKERRAKGLIADTSGLTEAGLGSGWRLRLRRRPGGVAPSCWASTGAVCGGA